MFINALARNNNMYHKNQQEDPLYAVARERKRKFRKQTLQVAVLLGSRYWEDI